jgi:alpha-galactosidase
MNKASFIVSKAQPGAWNDLDMLEVGNGAMSDTEYVAHFSMCKLFISSSKSITKTHPGAVAKSPLIMGNDIRSIAPADLSILSNAAVIAVSQDPLGSSAARRWVYATNSSTIPGTTAGAIQMWSGNLKSTTGGDYNDMVVLLINGGNTNLSMNATLADIFVDSGPLGTAPQVSMAWEVRDLWANRMSDAEAQAIIDMSNTSGNATAGYNSTIVNTGRYNATATSYANGLAANNTLLLGNITTTVLPSGTVTAMVEPHGAALFRLRALPTGALRKRDEL